MDLRYSDAEQAFRADLRAWLEATLPTLPPKPDPHDWPGRRAYDTHWQRLLFDAGYAGVDWPTEGGGRGASAIEELIFKEELERAHAPYVGVNFVGLLHAGPTIIAEGTPEQKARFLPAILKGEDVWCQGFSEPNAGSDLASMRTRAIRDGDDYVVTGQKIWTSHAEVADHCELLVRTGPEDSRHRGITWLILPMDAPGVDIRPLSTIAGSTEFAELFLDEVRVPVANRVGEENDGWRVTMVTLSFERGTAFVGDLLEAFELLSTSVAVARAKTLLEEFGLADAGNRLAKTYSGGMRRRLDLAAALVAEPPILFLDEPTTGLDPQSRSDLWNIIERLVESGTTVLLTTQYLEEADLLADRVGIIDKGKIVAEGTPADLKAEIGRPSVHAIPRRDADRSAIAEFAWLRDTPVDMSRTVLEGPGLSAFVEGLEGDAGVADQNTFSITARDDKGVLAPDMDVVAVVSMGGGGAGGGDVRVDCG
mgnify:CR=1 FL=1